MLPHARKIIIAAMATGALVSACSSLPVLSELPGFRKAPPPVSTAGAVSASNVLQPPGGKLTAYLPMSAYPNGIDILGPPPEPDSAQGRADRTIYETTRALAGSPRWAQAVRDDDLSGPSAFKSLACKAGLTVTPQTMPKTTELLIRAGLDASLVSTIPKKRYTRTRPLIGNDSPVCIARADWLKTNGSYPSGHSAMGWTWALILAELSPDHTTEILTRGREFGDSRVVCGVHFQSDVDAGRVLASSLFSRLHADPTFNADLRAARREVAKFRASGVAADCGGVTGG